jgi:hypothetical protein
MSSVALHSSPTKNWHDHDKEKNWKDHDPGRTWKDIYVAALLEGDEARMLRLIAEAEAAIVQRARELFGAAGDHIQEEHAMDDALYALHALKSCLAIHGHFAQAA